MPRADAKAGVTGRSPEKAAAIERDLARIDQLARLLDARYKLPFIPFRIGLDSMIGLVPGIGDLIASAPAVWILAKGWQHGARRRVLLRMASNSGIDLVLGSVPLVGDIFDATYKSNLRNAELLRRELRR